MDGIRGEFEARWQSKIIIGRHSMPGERRVNRCRASPARRHVTHQIELAVSFYAFPYHPTTGCRVGTYRILKRPITIAFQDSNSAVATNRDIRLSIVIKVSYDHAAIACAASRFVARDFLRLDLCHPALTILWAGMDDVAGRPLTGDSRAGRVRKVESSGQREDNYENEKFFQACDFGCGGPGVCSLW
jgi:hypothetical protein